MASNNPPSDDHDRPVPISDPANPSGFLDDLLSNVDPGTASTIKKFAPWVIFGALAYFLLRD